MFNKTFVFDVNLQNDHVYFSYERQEPFDRENYISEARQLA